LRFLRVFRILVQKRLQFGSQGLNTPFTESHFLYDLPVAQDWDLGQNRLTPQIPMNDANADNGGDRAPQ
jgi:hypothetical protein